MLHSLDSSPQCWLCSIRPWMRINPNGSSTTAWSDRTRDSASDQCPQSRMSRAHSCGSRPPTTTIPNTGLVLWMSSWKVSRRLRHDLATSNELACYLLAYVAVNKEDERHRMDCDEKGPTGGKVCRVDVRPNNFGVCTKDQKYGYPKASPCVFLKLNKVKIVKLFFSAKLN